MRCAGGGARVVYKLTTAHDDPAIEISVQGDGPSWAFQGRSRRPSANPPLMAMRDRLPA